MNTYKVALNTRDTNFLLTLREFTDSGVVPQSRIPNTKHLDSFGVAGLLAIPQGRPPENFAEAADKAAYQLCATGQAITVFWSGGLDSTVALVALIKAADPGQLAVTANNYAVAEAPTFYATHIQGKIQEVLLADAYSNAGLKVTGELGDQIFGSDLLKKFWSTQYFEPWKDLVASKAPAALMSYFEAVEAACPRPIENLYDMLWWWNFSQKWGHVKYRMLLDHEAARLAPHTFQPFFEHPAFQLWALNTPAKVKCPQGYGTYKLAAKEYIVAGCGDSVWLSKPKVPSLTNIHKPLGMGLTSDFELVQAVEFKEIFQ